MFLWVFRLGQAQRTVEHGDDRATEHEDKRRQDVGSVGVVGIDEVDGAWGQSQLLADARPAECRSQAEEKAVHPHVGDHDIANLVLPRGLIFYKRIEVPF